MRLQLFLFSRICYNRNKELWQKVVEEILLLMDKLIEDTIYVYKVKKLR
ncbi:hypothetical protein [Clostridium formicaceticum]|jgi:enamine deaminase RidA (YjgF/YER057c/UK114 family)|nr:hypothetical protein [Clostridium formicaceticum]